ncbi:beta-1,6-N-acetylglucosaminyltransferase [Cyclobacterium xiamenense]|uniref:beta-1,6-N-acetylglucosaminyltransferase n=1 Tax=Cyclobacterium xiamenense TaxID=1297121 RepID=UPI0035D036B9
MKHAVLFLAYKNLHHLADYMDLLDDDFLFFVHIDKKSVVTEAQLRALSERKNVRLISRKYTVNWGGLNLLKAIIYLAKEALKDPQVGYIHTMSGQDLPIKRSQEIKEFFVRNNGKQFIEHFPLPTARWAEGGLNRLNYFNLYDTFDRKTRMGAFFIHTALNIQRFFGIRRKPFVSFPKLYGGSTWWSLTRDCVRFVLDTIEKNPVILKRLRYTKCAEEILFQTVLMNSPYKTAIVGSTLTLVIWEYRNGNSPATLDKSDLPRLLESPQLFARRFDYPTSSDLVKLVRAKLTQRNASNPIES